MNLRTVKQFIDSYKKHFKYIHGEEIYKWRAVKCFQDHWDVHANEFPEMLNQSLALSKNLLGSGYYYPKRMIHKNAENDPEFVRNLFMNLFNERKDLIGRITSFQAEIKEQTKISFPGKNDYQDPRALLVYLSLRYPDRYYLYKYRMFEKFATLVEYPYYPEKGDIQNILQYLTLCNILKEEVIKDNELIELHITRITNREFFDTSCNILTQDIIYAATKHIHKFEKPAEQTSVIERLKRIDRTIHSHNEKISFKGSFTNYIENEKENKRIGDMGELLVLQYEQEKLASWNAQKQPEHKSKTEGDGLGYDILSYDKTGKEIFIEVKTTCFDFETPFYITRPELERSKRDSEKFLLYRLYNFDDLNNTAEYSVRPGDLTELCQNPVLFRVNQTKE